MKSIGKKEGLSQLETPHDKKSKDINDKIENRDNKSSMKSPIAVASSRSPSQKFLEEPKQKKLESYKDLDNLDWEYCVIKNRNPDWLSLYPVNAKDGITNPVSLHQLPPRTAAKLYLDALFMLEKYDENQKYLQDRIPTISHKYYKKKQWCKQLLQACYRVCCRLAKGLGIQNNCIAEDVFVFALFQETAGFGWRRIESQIEELPVTEKDRDFNRILKHVSSDEISNLFSLDSNELSNITKSSLKAGTKELKKGEAEKLKKQAAYLDPKTWFDFYISDDNEINNHFV